MLFLCAMCVVWLQQLNGYIYAVHPLHDGVFDVYLCLQFGHRVIKAKDAKHVFVDVTSVVRKKEVFTQETYGESALSQARQEGNEYELDY